jgi:hypothetical protein
MKLKFCFLGPLPLQRVSDPQVTLTPVTLLFTSEKRVSVSKLIIEGTMRVVIVSSVFSLKARVFGVSTMFS